MSTDRHDGRRDALGEPGGEEAVAPCCANTSRIRSIRFCW